MSIPTLLRRCAGAIPALFSLLGCQRYSDFALPAPAGAPGSVTYQAEILPAPVVARGTPGQWDSADALNPSVVKQAGKYFNFYSGFDGKIWHTGLAVSFDGLVWIKRGRVLSPDPTSWEGGYIAANGSALYSAGKFLYWYQAGVPPSIGLASSADGVSWHKAGPPVLSPGPRGAWDERGVADPYVIEAGTMFYMYFLGQDRARRQRLGLARSADGRTWEKLRSNPVLELGESGAFDENGLGEPAVWVSHGWYWMLYTGRNRTEQRRIGLALSRDGVRWQRASLKPVLTGDQSWNSMVVCDPTVLVEGNMVRVWLGGGNAARPDENLNGQIGLAIMRPVGANLSK